MARLPTIFIFLILFVACEKNQEFHESDYQYFPIQIGQYQIYEITESMYSISAQPTTRKFYLKERIIEQYNTIEDGNLYKVERLKRTSTNQSWKIDSVWTTQLLPNKAIRTENNISYVKLIFPIHSGQFWNKNEYNNLTEQKISYKNIKENFSIDSKTYPSTISVVVRNDSSLLSKTKNIEVYALNYGMIYRENTNLAYCQSTPTCIGKKLIDYGIEQQIKLIEMGIER